MSLPSSLQYFVNSIAGQVERTNIRIIADGNNSPAMNSSIQLSFPTDAVIDLTSLTMVATLKSSYAVDASAQIVVPNTASLFRAVQWQLNGNTVCGGNNFQHGQVYEALRRACVGTDYARSRADTYERVELCDSDGKFQGSEALTQTGHRIHITEFFGLQKSPNASAWDTSIFGSLKLQLQLAGDNILLCAKPSAVSQSLGWELANVAFYVDVLRLPEIYDQICLQRLQEGTIETCFPDIVSQIAGNNSNIRFNVSSQSLNYIGWASLPSEYLSATTVVAASDGVVAAANSPYGPNYNLFKLQNTSNAVPSVDSITETYFWNVNGKSYPAIGNVPVVDGCAYTKDAFTGNDVNGYNLLFAGLVQPDGTQGRTVTYRRENFLANNAIVVHKTCLSEAHSDPMRMMSGLNTAGSNAQVALNTSGWSTTDYVLMFAGTTTTLSASAGQQVAVTY